MIRARRREAERKLSARASGAADHQRLANRLNVPESFETVVDPQTNNGGPLISDYLRKMLGYATGMDGRLAGLGWRIMPGRSRKAMRGEKSSPAAGKNSQFRWRGKTDGSFGLKLSHADGGDRRKVVGLRGVTLDTERKL